MDRAGGADRGLEADGPRSGARLGLLGDGRGVSPAVWAIAVLAFRVAGLAEAML